MKCWKQPYYVLVMCLLALLMASCASLSGDLMGPVDQDDIAIQRNAMERLMVEDIAVRGGIVVEVNGGVATVNGTVRGEQMRMRALSIIRGTPGVSRVEDKLRVL